jgi:prevent-host-death family protein
MQRSRSISISDLKGRLLEVVRRVERGETFQITREGIPVATLSSHGAWSRRATGFARVDTKGALEAPAAGWTFDVDNLKPRRKRKA